MLLDDIKLGDLAVFSNGDQAFVEGLERNSDKIYIMFSEGVLGCHTKSTAWRYLCDGRFYGGGNNIVKVVHTNGE